MTPYLVHPNDVVFFRGNKPFDFGEWYSEGIFPPYPSTFQGFVRTAMLNKLKLIDTAGKLTDDAQAEKNVGNDVTMPFEIYGPFLFKTPNEFFFAMPLDCIIEDGNIKPLELIDEEIESDLGWKMRMPNVKGKIKWAQDSHPFISLTQFNEYRKNKAFAPLDEKEIPSMEEPRTGIMLKYGAPTAERIKMTEEGHFYVTQYQRLAKDIALYFHTTSPIDLEGVYGKLGSEARGAWITRTDVAAKFKLDDKYYADIEKNGLFKLILLQPGIFANGWLPFKEIGNKDGWSTLEHDGIRMRLLYARTGMIAHIGGMSLRRMGTPSKATRGTGLKPMLNAVASGAVYFLQIIENDDGTDVKQVLKSWDGGKITHNPFSSMGFNQIALA